MIEANNARMRAAYIDVYIYIYRYYFKSLRVCIYLYVDIYIYNLKEQFLLGHGGAPDRYPKSKIYA